MTDKVKVKDKLAKLKAQMESAHAIGSTHEAEAFAAVLNRLLVEHELAPSDLEYAQKEEPIVERKIDFDKHSIEKKHMRLAWQDAIGNIVARANMCAFLVRTRTNQGWFAGTPTHTEVAEYMFVTLVRNAQRLADEGYSKRWHELLKTCARCGEQRKDHRKDREGRLTCPKTGDTFKTSVTEARGYIATFLNAFVRRIGDRLTEERRRARREEAAARGTVAYAENVSDVLAGMPEAPADGPESQALIRLDQALQRSKAYVAQKYGKRAHYSSGRTGANALGRQDGHAAADRVSFTQGIRGGKVQKQIGG